MYFIVYILLTFIIIIWINLGCEALYLFCGLDMYICMCTYIMYK